VFLTTDHRWRGLQGDLLLDLSYKVPAQVASLHTKFSRGAGDFIKLNLNTKKILSKKHSMCFIMTPFEESIRLRPRTRGRSRHGALHGARGG
jgi:hypothetical protein